MKYNKISTIALIISIIALAFTFIRITPFEISNDAYISLIATFIGISVTLIIGFQIINTMQIRKELSEQKERSSDLSRLSKELNDTINTQNYEMQEGFDIINALIEYQRSGESASAEAFKSIHHALLSSIKTNRTNYEWIFLLLRKYISEINSGNFVSGFSITKDGCYKCNNPNSPYFQKELKDIVKETNVQQINKDEKEIRQEKNFCRIQIEYDRVMKLYRKRIEDMLKDPMKELRIEEKISITNPR